MFIGLAEAALLIALGLGYIVCYLANREEKALRTAGYAIGLFIITLSVLLILQNIFLTSKFCGRISDRGRMDRPHKMMMQGQMPAQPQQAPVKK